MGEMSSLAQVTRPSTWPSSARSAMLRRTMPRHMMARCCEPFPLPSALAGPVTFDITSNYTHVPTMRDDVAHDGRRAKLPGGGEACFDARCRACRRRFHAGVSRVPAPTTSPCPIKFFCFRPVLYSALMDNVDAAVWLVIAMGVLTLVGVIAWVP